MHSDVRRGGNSRSVPQQRGLLASGKNRLLLLTVEQPSARLCHEQLLLGCERNHKLAESGHFDRADGPAFTRRCVFLVQLLNLLLHLAAKFQRMRDFVKWLGSPARPDHHNRSVTQHPAERRLAHFDALHFV